MGYYTTYSLRLYGNEKDVKEFGNRLKSCYPRNERDIDDLLSDLLMQGKFYDITDRISEIAEDFPDMLICLEGVGECRDDIWEQRWKGEETEGHRMVMPPFTELKTPSERLN